MKQNKKQKCIKKIFTYLSGVLLVTIVINVFLKFASPHPNFLLKTRNTLFTNSHSNKPKLPEIDYILVEKGKRTLSLYHQRQLIKSYNIALGISPLGHKMREGDGKTPEGLYFIALKNPQSSYHLSLKISYPSKQDVDTAKSKGFKPGDNIMIHGIRNGLGWIGNYHSLVDWTRGCIAVSNDAIEEIYSSIKVGTIVEIKP